MCSKEQGFYAPEYAALEDLISKTARRAATYLLSKDSQGYETELEMVKSYARNFGNEWVDFFAQAVDVYLEELEGESDPSA